MCSFICTNTIVCVDKHICLCGSKVGTNKLVRSSVYSLQTANINIQPFINFLKLSYEFLWLISPPFCKKVYVQLEKCTLDPCSHKNLWIHWQSAYKYFCKMGKSLLNILCANSISCLKDVPHQNSLESKLLELMFKMVKVW